MLSSDAAEGAEFESWVMVVAGCDVLWDAAAGWLLPSDVDCCAVAGNINAAASGTDNSIEIFIY
jgi:hypothetical protein